jgi:N-acetylneuraminic acid mutarotase
MNVRALQTVWILILTFILIPSGSAQWVQVSSDDIGGRFGAMSFTLADSGYVVGGIKQSGASYLGYKQLLRYDAATDSWAERPVYPGGNVYGGIALGFDSIAVVGLGGNQTGNLSNQLWSFKNTTQTWKRLANFPGTRRVYPFYFCVGAKAYVGGGVAYDGGEPQYLNDLWEYDLANDTWARKADYPGKGRVGVAAFAIADRAFAGIGDDGQSFHDDLYEYDAAGDVWIQRGNVVGEIKSFPQTIAYGGKGYVIGGERGHLDFSSAVLRYEPASDSWESLGLFKGAPRRNAILFEAGGQIFYGLGQFGPEDDMVVGDLWKYTVPAAVYSDKAEADAHLYPIPSFDELAIQISGSVEYTVRIFNVLGCEVWSGRFIGASQVAAPAAAGLYFYHIETVNGVIGKGKFQKVSAR